MRKSGVLRFKRVSACNKHLLDMMKGYLLPATLLMFVGLMLAFPSHYLDSARKGLASFSSNVLPAIFPFVFLSNLMAKTSIIDDISKAFEKPIKKLFGVTRQGGFVLFSSLICGYPVGSATICELYTSGAITESEAKSYIPLSSTASPIFILATVGGALFSDKNVGVIILLSHYVATFLNGILWRFITKSRERRGGGANVEKKRVSEGEITHARASVHTHTSNNENIVGDAVAKATSSMLAVGGYIVLFGLVVDTLTLIPQFDTLPFSVKSAICSLIEMTRGVVYASNISSKPLAVALATLSVTFGGLSVNLQNYHFLSRCKCSVKEVILPKISQGIFAFFVSNIFSIIFFNIFGIKG